MIKLSSSIYINSPARIVWAKLAELENIQLWVDTIATAKCHGDRLQGVGVQRVCTFKNGIKVTERFTAWHEGESFTYEGSGMPLVKLARNTWSVFPTEEQQCLLVSEAEVELSGGWLGKMLDPVMNIWMRRMEPTSLAGFKHWIETGTNHRVP